MSAITKSVYNWAKNSVKSQDMYSRSISFTFENKDKYSTLWGGTVSIIIFIAALMFGYLKFYTMIMRSSTNTSINQVVQDLSTSGQTLNLNSSSFYFALKTNYNTTNILQTGGYLNVRYLT